MQYSQDWDGSFTTAEGEEIIILAEVTPYDEPLAHEASYRENHWPCAWQFLKAYKATEPEATLTLEECLALGVQERELAEYFGYIDLTD